MQMLIDIPHEATSDCLFVEKKRRDAQRRGN